jgi:plasmid stabilization system protein ParE
VSSYKLTRKAEADLESVMKLSVRRFGSEAALRFLDSLERHLEALARHEYEGARIAHRSLYDGRTPPPEGRKCTGP